MNRLIFFVVILSLNCVLFAQNNYEKEYKTVIPGAEYQAGSFHRFLFGDHWRELWTSPVTVEVLNLEKFGGGLIPIKKGGGMQTKSLRFQGGDGLIWKFRSINKDPSKILPEILRETIADDLLQDQISSSNPMAPLIAAPLLNAVGVLQAEPYLVYLPDDPKLGEFREDFGGMLGMIEIHPDESDDENDPGFAGADKVMGTFKLFHRLEDKRDEWVDAPSFLKARLMDILLGDWDRHTDQWRWARYDYGKNEIWYPVPRDRDQALAKFDGLFPMAAEYMVPQLVHFDYTYPQAEDITWSGRFLDRRFLGTLDKPTWDSVTANVFNKITDEVIEEAVSKLPPEYYAIASSELIAKLKSRRDLLFEVSDEFYELVNKYIDVFCTDKDEFVEVTRMNNLQTEIVVYKRDKDTGNKKDDPLYYKLTDNNITREIRIYKLKGDDKTIIRGDVECGPIIRVIGDGGKDEYIDSSNVSGYFLYVTPIPDAETMVYFYDSGNKSKFTTSSGTGIDTEEVPEPKDDFEKYEPQIRDRGHDWLINPVLSLNSDDGLLIGGGPILIRYGFRFDPYEYKQSLSFAYASKPNSGKFEYSGIFYSIVKGLSFTLDFTVSDLALTKYYGFGNETAFCNIKENTDYYNLEQKYLKIEPGLEFSLGTNHKFGFGIGFESSNISILNSFLLNDFPDPSYGLGVMRAFEVNTNFNIDTRDHPEQPNNGLYLNLHAEYYPELMTIKERFARANFDVRTYFTLKKFISPSTLALRMGGGRNWGEYPFYLSQFLGGDQDLRGFNRKRFAGDASLFGQVELRSHLIRTKILIPADIGLILFGETGRVYTNGGLSKAWHPSFGFGLSASIIKKMLTFSSHAAFSKEEIFSIYFDTSMAF